MDIEQDGNKSVVNTEFTGADGKTYELEIKFRDVGNMMVGAYLKSGRWPGEMQAAVTVNPKTGEILRSDKITSEGADENPALRGLNFTFPANSPEDLSVEEMSHVIIEEIKKSL